MIEKSWFILVQTNILSIVINSEYGKTAAEGRQLNSLTIPKTLIVVVVLLKTTHVSVSIFQSFCRTQNVVEFLRVFV